mgnify:CR=1 FL=1
MQNSLHIISFTTIYGVYQDHIPHALDGYHDLAYTQKISIIDQHKDSGIFALGIKINWVIILLLIKPLKKS